MKERAKILIVDDELNIRRMLRAALPDEDFEVIESETGKEGVRSVAMHNPDIVILDLGLSDIDGIECIKQIRAWSNVPIIVLSARGEEETKVRALDLGADDYVTKPFGMPELIARLRVALRIHRGKNDSETPWFECGDLKIDFSLRSVVVRGQQVHLTPNEYKLLCFLAKNAGRVLTHKQILSNVWGAAFTGQNHYVRILMRGLRQKIEKVPTRPELLCTESGIGYRLRLF